MSTRTGSNSAIFSTNQKYYINTFSNISTPTLITLNDNRGKELTTLLDNSKLKAQTAQLNMPQKEFFTFRTSSGVELNGWMMKPANFNANKNIRSSCINTADRVLSRLLTAGESEASATEACLKLICAIKDTSWFV